MTADRFDYIIIGAGAAGCILAGRLSADPDIDILLIEAGMDISPGAEPAEILDPFPAVYGNPRYSWPGLIATVGPDRGNGRGRFSRQWIQGKLVGGGSSINGMLAQRGAPTDFAEWAALGAAGWSWDDVLPFYRRLENDLDFDTELHGRSGPVPIRRHAREQWPPFIKAFVTALEADGLPVVPDIHAAHVDGVSPAAMNNLPDRRIGSAQAYLDRAARQRPNLTILSDSLVERLLLQGQRATGVRVRTPSGVVEFVGSEIIVCAGAIQSPSLLMRSGLGPASELSALGIQVVANLPGVGQGLQNHPAFHVAAHLPAAAAQPRDLRAPFHVLARFSSGQADCPPTDLAAFAVPRAAWHPLGNRIGALSCFVHKPYSRGTVELVSADASTMPRIDFNLLSDPRDFKRLMVAAQRMLHVLAHPVMKPVTNDFFLPSGGHANAFNTPTRLNWLKSWIAMQAFEASPGVRRRLLRQSIVDPASLAADPEALAEAIRLTAACVHHPTGTCRIGLPTQREAVLDARCRVHGIDGLRVADTSVMPTIVTSGTHLTAMMIGERVADLVLRDRAAASAGQVIRSRETSAGAIQAPPCFQPDEQRRRP